MSKELEENILDIADRTGIKPSVVAIMIQIGLRDTKRDEEGRLRDMGAPDEWMADGDPP